MQYETVTTTCTDFSYKMKLLFNSMLCYYFSQAHMWMRIFLLWVTSLITHNAYDADDIFIVEK